MDIILSLGLGLGTRAAMHTLTNVDERLSAGIVGVLEGVVLLQHKESSSYDQVLAYVLRICLDLLITQSWVRMVAVILWTGVGAALCVFAPFREEKPRRRSSGSTGPDGMPRRHSRRTRSSSRREPARSANPSSLPEPSPEDVRAIPATSVVEIPMELEEGLLVTVSTSAENVGAQVVGINPASEREETESLDSFASRASSVRPRNTSSRDLTTLPPAPTSFDAPSEAVSRPKFQTNLSIVLEETPGSTSTTLPSIAEDVAGIKLETEQTPTMVSSPLPENSLTPQPHYTTLPPTSEANPDIEMLIQNLDAGESEDTHIVSCLSPAVAVSSRFMPDEDDVMSIAETEMTEPESVISGRNRPPEYQASRAQLIREEAGAEEAVRDQKVRQQRAAETHGHAREAFLLRQEINQADIRIRRLHERAERRYFFAYNSNTTSNTIDVHGLKPAEAIRRTELAFRRVLLSKGTEFRVIVGRGNHSKGGVPILKPKILAMMQKHNISTRVDARNPGVLVITIPA